MLPQVIARAEGPFITGIGAFGPHSQGRIAEYRINKTVSACIRAFLQPAALWPTPPESGWGQKPNLPHCNGNGWFTSKSSRNWDNAALTLCAKALNRYAIASGPGRR
jgi:hypothetical protein